MTKRQAQQLDFDEAIYAQMARESVACNKQQKRAHFELPDNISRGSGTPRPVSVLFYPICIAFNTSSTYSFLFIFFFLFHEGVRPVRSYDSRTSAMTYELLFFHEGTGIYVPVRQRAFNYPAVSVVLAIHFFSLDNSVLFLLYCLLVTFSLYFLNCFSCGECK